MFDAVFAAIGSPTGDSMLVPWSHRLKCRFSRQAESLLCAFVYMWAKGSLTNLGCLIAQQILTSEYWLASVIWSVWLLADGRNKAWWSSSTSPRGASHRPSLYSSLNFSIPTVSDGTDEMRMPRGRKRAMEPEVKQQVVEGQ